MRISDWSSDVCSSDLACVHGRLRGGDADCDAFIAESLVAAVARPYGEPDEARVKRTGAFHAICRCIGGKRFAVLRPDGTLDEQPDRVIDRKRVVEGKSVSVRGDLGGGRVINNKIET